MSETMQSLRDGVAWVRGMTLIGQHDEIRPAALSYVRPTEYRQSAEHLITRLFDALAAAEHELERVRQERDALLAFARQCDIDAALGHALPDTAAPRREEE